MKITFILPFASLAGGIRVVATYAKILTERGHEVFVVSQPQARSSLSARVKSVLGVRGARRVVPATPLLDFLGDRHRVLDRVRPVTADDVPDADVLFATWWATAADVHALPSRKGTPFYLLQDYEVYARNKREEVIASYGLPLHKIAVSSFIREAVQKHVPDHKIDLVLNAVDTAHFRQPARAKNIDLTVGFLYKDHPRKRISLAIDACALARDIVPGLKVVAFGAKTAPEDTTFPPWITYQTAPPQTMIPALYGACDAWLFTSETEGFGLPILEAMACGTPVLATRAGAASDLIDGRNGRLLAPDPNIFANAIAAMNALSPSDWKMMSDEAIATAHRHRWDDATDALLSVITRRSAFA